MLTTVRILLIAAECFAAWCLARAMTAGYRYAHQGGAVEAHTKNAYRFLLSMIPIALAAFAFAMVRGRVGSRAIFALHDSLVVMFLVLSVLVFWPFNGRKAPAKHAWFVYSYATNYVALMVTGTHLALQ